MATRTRQLPPPDDNDEIVIDGEADDITQIENDTDEELGRITAEFGGDAREREHKIKVYRVEGGNMAHCFDCAPSELPIVDRVRDEYGPGNYAVRVYTKQGSGQFKLTRATKFSLARPAIPTTPGAQSTDFSRALEAMAKQQQMMFEQMKNLVMQSSGRAATADPIQSMVAIMGAMAQFREVLQPPKTDSMADLLKMVALVKEIGIGGSSGNETSLLDIARDLLKSEAFGNAISSLGKQSAQSAVMIPHHVNGTPIPPVQSQPLVSSPNPNGENVGIIQDQMIKAQISRLVQLAAENKDTSLYADLIADQLPENVIREHLLAPGAIDRAAALVPDVNNYRPWFAALERELRNIFEGESGEPAVAQPIIGGDE